MRKSSGFGVAVVLCLWAAGLVFPAHRVWRSTAALDSKAPPQKAVCISSLNTDMVTDTARMARDIDAAGNLGTCDVLLLQEVVRSAGELSVAEQFAKETGRHAAFASPTGAETLSGLAILSRYPIRDVETVRLKQFELVYKVRHRLALAATIDTPLGPVRVVNTHLDTRINSGDRVEQLTPVIQHAERFTGPRIIGGDFNTNNNAWLGHVLPLPFFQIQTAAVRDLMDDYGFQSPFRSTGPTHKMFGMRLDWIYAKQMNAWDAGIERIAFSDHHAIWARFQLN